MYDTHTAEWVRWVGQTVVLTDGREVEVLAAAPTASRYYGAKLEGTLPTQHHTMTSFYSRDVVDVIA